MMKRYILFLIALVFFASGCGKEDPVSVRSFADFYKGKVLQTVASRGIETNEWSGFENVTIVVSEDGKNYVLNPGEEESGKGSIIWRHKNGVHTVDFVNEENVDESGDESVELGMTFIEHDENHVIAEVQWGQIEKEWLLVAGEDNLKGLVVDQEGAPLAEVIVKVSSDAGEIGEVVTDEFGYFGVNKKMPGFEDLSESNGIVLLLKGYADEKKEVAPGEYFLIKMQKGKSSLDHGKVYGYITDSETKDPLNGVAVSYSSGNDVAYTDNQGYYEIMVPFSEKSVSVFVEGYEEKNSSVSLENSDQVQLDFSLIQAGSTVAGEIKNINSQGLEGVSVLFKNKDGVIVDSFTSDGEGGFSFKHIVDGVYLMSVSKSGMQFVPPQQLVPVTGQNISDVKFIGIAQGETGVGGKVLSKNSYKPVEGVVVTCGNASAISDVNGYYVMEVEKPGSSFVLTSKEGFMPRYQEVLITQDLLKYNNMTIAPESSGVIHTLQGYVYDDVSMEALANVEITIADGFTTTSNSTGYYAVEMMVYDESSQFVPVTCEKSGYETYSDFISISLTGVEYRTLYLHP